MAAVIKVRGEIGQMALFLGQFDNAQQTVAQHAIFFLDDIGQVLKSAPIPDPAPGPTPRGRHRHGQPQHRKDEPQCRRCVPKPIGNEKRDERDNQAGDDRAEGDGGFDAPEAFLDIVKLAAQLLRKRHRQVIIILGHYPTDTTSLRCLQSPLPSKQKALKLRVSDNIMVPRNFQWIKWVDREGGAPRIPDFNGGNIQGVAELRPPVA